MAMKECVDVFDQDAETHDGYVYTTDGRLSCRLATRTLTDVTLKAGCLTGRRVVDMGCGDGFFTIRYWDEGCPSEILGTDVAPKAIQVANARKGSRPITFWVGDSHKLPFSDDRFDLAILQGALHHDDDPLASVREALRLAPAVLIIEANGNNPGLKVLEKVSKYHREHKEKSFTRRQLAALIEQAGGCVAHHERAGFVPMFCPDWVARVMKAVEPLMEAVPPLSTLGCAVHVVIALRRGDLRDAGRQEARRRDAA